jgi:hypothetical protein
MMIGVPNPLKAELKWSKASITKIHKVNLSTKMHFELVKCYLKVSSKWIHLNPKPSNSATYQAS